MKTTSLLTASLATSVLGLVPSTSVRAQEDPDRSFAIEQFEPLPGLGTNILNIGRSDVTRHLTPSFGLVFHYQDDPLNLVFAEDPEQIERRIVDYVLKGEVWFGLGLFDVIDIGFVMPLILAQSATDLDFDSETPQEFNSFTTGDLRIVPKVRILDSRDFGGFGLALMAPIHLPTGDSGSYHSEGSVRIEPRLVLEYQTRGGFSVSANLGFMARSRQQVLNFINTNALRWGLGVEIPLVEDHLALIGVAYGAVGVGEEVDISANNTAPAEALGGIQFWFDDNWGGNVAAGAGLTSGVGSPDFRAALSIGYSAVDRKRDTDGDGLLDPDDKCPLDPEDYDGFEDSDGCPEPDNDGDGVLDVTDGADDGSGFGRCRDTAEDVDGFEDADGCPDLDNDADGIPDATDGILDASGFGACRNAPEDKDGFEDGDGCPDVDNDGDGILDVADGPADNAGFGTCRDQPETINEWEDEDGCPDEKPRAILTETAIKILERVYFDFNKATLQDRSYPLLDVVASILNDNPNITLVRVEGHTDRIGTRAYNLGLSDRRAKAVTKYLVSKGVTASRFIAKGYGFDFPIDTNDTEEGRDQNRRVEFNILEIDGKPIQNQVIRTKATK